MEVLTVIWSNLGDCSSELNSTFQFSEEITASFLPHTKSPKNKGISMKQIL